jgi:hypothetical protein
MTESRDRLADALADRYLLEEALGRGATATVYLAQDVRMMHPRLGADLSLEALDAQRLAQGVGQPVARFGHVGKSVRVCTNLQ